MNNNKKTKWFIAGLVFIMVIAAVAVVSMQGIKLNDQTATLAVQKRLIKDQQLDDNILLLGKYETESGFTYWFENKNDSSNHKYFYSLFDKKYNNRYELSHIEYLSELSYEKDFAIVKSLFIPVFNEGGKSILINNRDCKKLIVDQNKGESIEVDVTEYPFIYVYTPSSSAVSLGAITFLDANGEEIPTFMSGKYEKCC